jgi:hypothetical protein
VEKKRRKRKRKKVDGEKRVGVNFIPRKRRGKAQVTVECSNHLKDLFKAKCARRGFSMSAKIIQYMEEYVSDEVI